MPYLTLRSNPMSWLIAAGIFHLLVTVGVFLVGHFQLLPGTFDTNGIGLSFAIDGATYRNLASQMVGGWQANGFSTWVAMPAPLHCRLYSLPFALVGGIVGHNILAAESLNLVYYLGILSSIYLLGRELFNSRAGLLAAAIVGALPSFVLHTTQLIRDPLAILCLLGLLFVLTSLLSREFSWRETVAVGIGSPILVTAFWLARGNMWNVVFIAVGITIVLLALRLIRERRFLAGNVTVVLLVFAAVLLVPSRFESTTLPGTKPPATPLTIPSASQPVAREGLWTQIIDQIGTRRAGFRSYRSQASNIDSDVRLESTADVVRFIPRAAVIGFLAPFPRMWVQSGTSGTVGRVVSGLETLAMYFLYIAVGVCLWQERRSLRMWLTFLVATTGLVALGLVVVNAGALYRIRYAFWIMLIIIAAEGILIVVRTRGLRI